MAKFPFWDKILFNYSFLLLWSAWNLLVTVNANCDKSSSWQIDIRHGKGKKKWKHPQKLFKLYCYSIIISSIVNPYILNTLFCQNTTEESAAELVLFNEGYIATEAVYLVIFLWGYGYLEHTEHPESRGIIVVDWDISVMFCYFFPCDNWHHSSWLYDKPLTAIFQVYRGWVLILKR